MKVEVELKNGRRKSFPEAIARVLVKRGVGTYQTRELRATQHSAPEPEPTADAIAEGPAAESAPAEDAAPYGYKVDGTPRKRPGRTPSEG